MTPTGRLMSGKYEILEKIGQGGMGAVYKARHVVLESIVALKLLPSRVADKPELVTRFQREARVMAKLRHPNIVRVFDIERDGDVYYLVQEFIDGENLAQYLRAHAPLDLGQALDIACQVGRALAYAHDQRVIHRDVKPSNVLIDRAMPPKASLTDFGIAKVEDAGDHTRTGTVLGSVKYSAPEQLGYKIDGVPVPIDGRADLYALGMLTYELIEGRPVFDGLDPAEVIGQLLFETTPMEPAWRRAVPEGLESAIRRSIARNPANRQANLRAMLETLEKVRSTVEERHREESDRTVDMAEPPTIALEPSASGPAHGERPSPSPSLPQRPPEGEASVPAARARPRAERALPEVSDGPTAWGPPTRSRWVRRAAVGAGLALIVGAGVTFRGTVRDLMHQVTELFAPTAPLAWRTAAPEESTVEGRVGVRVPFAVTVDDPESHGPVKIAWAVDGVATGEGTRFAFTPTSDHEGHQVAVTATASEGSRTLRRTWTVAVGWTSPLIARADPVDADVQLESGARRRFEVATDARRGPGRSYRFVWRLDGRSVQDGPAPAWTIDGADVADRLLSVDVLDEAGSVVGEHAWRLQVQPPAPPVEPEAPAPTVVASTPARRSLRVGSSDQARFTAEVTPGTETEWRVDGRVVSRRDPALTLRHGLSPGTHTIEVAAVDPGGRRSGATRWTVDVVAPPKPPPTTPRVESAATAPEPAPPSTADRVTRAEAQRWIADVRGAWAQRDAVALRRLGLPFSERLLQSNSMIGDASILLDSHGARVKLDALGLDKMNQIVSVHPTEVRLRHDEHGGVTAR